MIVARKAARDVRGMTIGISLACFLLAVVTVALYPSFKDSLKDLDDNSALSGFTGQAGSFSSPEGWAQARFFSFIPLVLVMQGVISGSWAFVGEQTQGTMDLLLAQPVTRRRLVLEKAAALTAALAVSALCALPGFLITMPFTDEFTVSEGRIFGATFMLFPVAFLFLGASLWMSAVAPTRAAAATAVIAVVVSTFFLNLVGASSESLSWMQKLSPFYWSDSSEALVGNFPWAKFAVASAVGVVFLALAVVSFERRDIAAGSQDWSPRDIYRSLRRGQPAAAPATRGAESH